MIKNNNNEDNKDVAKTPVTRPQPTAPHVGGLSPDNPMSAQLILKQVLNPRI